MDNPEYYNVGEIESHLAKMTPVKRPPLPPKPNFTNANVRPVQTSIVTGNQLDNSDISSPGSRNTSSSKSSPNSKSSMGSYSSLPPAEFNLLNYDSEVSRSRSVTKGIDVLGKVSRLEQQTSEDNQRSFNDLRNNVRRSSRSVENVKQLSFTKKSNKVVSPISRVTNISRSRSASSDFASLVRVSSVESNKPQQPVLVVRKHSFSPGKKELNEVSPLIRPPKRQKPPIPPPRKIREQFEVQRSVVKQAECEMVKLEDAIDSEEEEAMESGEDMEVDEQRALINENPSLKIGESQNAKVGKKICVFSLQKCGKQVWRIYSDPPGTSLQRCFVFRTNIMIDIQTYIGIRISIRIPCVKLRTTYSTGAWWVKIVF